MSPKLRKILLWTLMLTLLAGLVIAGADLMGQANNATTDAGSNGADIEMSSFDMIKPGKSVPACDWKLEKSLQANIKKSDAEYQQLIAQAKQDLSAAGKVSEQTRQLGLTSANNYQKLSEDYAKMWENCNGKTRAKLARETGLSRVKNAELTFNEVSAERSEAYNMQQESLAAARKEYVAEAKGDLSEKDKAEISTALAPRVTKIENSLGELLKMIMGLITQATSQVSNFASNPVGAAAGCAVQQATTGTNPLSELITSLNSLQTLVSNMSSNVGTMKTDVSDLTGN